MNLPREPEQPRNKRYCFPLRLSASLRLVATELAHSEGTSLNQFISLAVAERISRMEDATIQRAQQTQGPGNINRPHR